MLKSLHRIKDVDEIISRIIMLDENSNAKWGRMNAAQMLEHCALVLEIPLHKIILPKKSMIIKGIGVMTKKEMKYFNNGIPPNMPTFDVLKVVNPCDFDFCRNRLLTTINSYLEVERKKQLPSQHALFGKMESKDWGFLEYKHLHHHLKQFGV